MWDTLYHISSQRPYLETTVTSSPLEEPLVETSLFHYEVADCTMLDISQYILWEVDTYRVDALEICLSSRGSLISSSEVLIALFVEGAVSFPLRESKVWLAHFLSRGLPHPPIYSSKSARCLATVILPL